uniref:DNA topoisomerase n=1 Tax=Panagrolaimus sp. PS1159 TaxID=55785 RepID=A0AC35GC41_9BILA
MALNPEAEEVATFYARLLGQEYTTKDIFNKNFFNDWRKTLTSEEREIIKELNKCDFRQIQNYFISEAENRKAMTKEEKLKLREDREKEQNEYGIALIDGHEQKIANFRIEPPGLFRGRGEHPKTGCLKRRIQPEDVIINCSKNSIPPPPIGHQWKEVKHDNSVAWLCSWTENILGQNKYILLNSSSKLKGEKDFEKFEKARSLGKIINQIRQKYFNEIKSKEMKIRQRAVALYFIDKFALRAGNEKDTNEEADTVGCCSLRCEHIKLFKEFEEKMLVFKI